MSSSRLAFRSKNSTSAEDKLRSKSVDVSKLSAETANTNPARSKVSPSPIMTTSTGKLVQEIYDEFLVCKICMESFKTPKCLSCLHTFCEICIENHIASESTYKKYSDYREFTCPLCRKRTQLPIGGAKKLPDNFLISNLSDTVDRQKTTSAPSCDICKMISKRNRDAVSKCLECNKLLCRYCVDQHKETKVTRDHSIFDVETEKDVICKEHSDEVVRFYCEPCQTCICVLCTFNEHKDHEVSSFNDAVLKYKADIEGILRECKEKLSAFELYLEQVNRTARQISEAESKIRELAIEFIGEVRQREKQLIEEVHNLYGQQTMDVIGGRVDLQASLDTLKSTCALTEVVLQGKDIELLLLKREVHEKLTSLTSAISTDLPKTLSKEIRFLPGHIELGSIQDMDRPNATKFRSNIMSNSSMDTFGMEECENAEVQTDPVEILDGLEITPTRDIGQNAIVSVPKPVLLDAMSQTTSVDFAHSAANTDIVEKEEKGVNTRSRVRDVAPDSAEQREHRGRRHRRADGTNGDPSSSMLQRSATTVEESQPQSESSREDSSYSGGGRWRRRMQFGYSMDDGSHSGCTDL